MLRGQVTRPPEPLERNDGAEKLRVLYVTPRFFPFIGGIEHHVNQVATRCAEAGVDVTVLTTDPSGRLLTRERVDGITIRRVRAYPSRRDYYFAPGVYSEILVGDWDVVHVQSYHTFVAPLAMLAALRAHVPFVVTFHGGGHSSRLRHMLRGKQLWALRPLLSRAQILIALARFEIDLFSGRLHLPPERFVLIPNGADLSLPHSEFAGRDLNLIASVGRLERYKGHHRVIEALPLILSQRPAMRLWIAGTGPYESRLRMRARELGVSEHVEIRAIPPRERAQMAKELSRVSLVTLLSEYETQPIALLEALAVGCSALVADTSGLSELAAQGLARAIPLDSTPREIAQAILEQLEHPLTPARLKLPTWDDCAHQLLAVYAAVAQRRVCAS